MRRAERNQDSGTASKSLSGEPEASIYFDMLLGTSAICPEFLWDLTGVLGVVDP